MNSNATKDFDLNVTGNINPRADKEDVMVTVCVQTYQHEGFIQDCLDSILKQKTNFSVEVLVGEDDSDDNTRQICKQYAEKHSDIIKLFLHDRKNVIYINKRATGRYNLLHNLKSAKGKYIAICEGDDYWIDEYKLQKQFDFMESNNDISICFHRSNLLENGELKLHHTPEGIIGKKIDYSLLLKHYNFIATPSVFLRRTNFKNIPLYMYRATFGDLALYKYISNDGLIYGMDQIMSVYRIHSGGIWSGISKKRAIRNYLSFYSTMFNELNVEEQRIVSIKIKQKLKELSLTNFRNKVLQGINYIILLIKFRNYL